MRFLSQKQFTPNIVFEYWIILREMGFLEKSANTFWCNEKYEYFTPAGEGWCVHCSHIELYDRYILYNIIYWSHNLNNTNHNANIIQYTKLK